MWLVLLSLETAEHRTQTELAEAVGVRQPTMTHHLDGLERVGLVTRDRDPANRRVQRVRLTAEGEAMFLRLRRAAAGFGGLLRAGLDDADVAQLRRLLTQLPDDVAAD